MGRKTETIDWHIAGRKVSGVAFYLAMVGEGERAEEIKLDSISFVYAEL